MKHVKHKIKLPSIHTHQRGVSLIELMISMSAGLFLLAGVVTNFISTQDQDKKRFAVSEMDSNATFAFRFLRQTISHAGYSSIYNVVPFDKPFFTKSDKNSVTNPICGDGTTSRDTYKLNSGYYTKDLDTSGRDQLTIITLADNPCNPGEAQCTNDNGDNVNPSALVFTDCNGGGNVRNARTVACSADSTVGMPDPREAKIYSTFKLFKGGNTSAVKDRVLYCYGSRSNGYPVIDNVEAIQYLYGVRVEGTGNIKFRTAKQVEDSSEWGMVTSVRVGLLLRSSNQNVLDEDAIKVIYQVLDQAITVTDLKRLYRVYSTTINLENTR